MLFLKKISDQSYWSLVMVARGRKLCWSLFGSSYCNTWWVANLLYD